MALSNEAASLPTSRPKLQASHTLRSTMGTLSLTMLTSERSFS